MISCIPTTTTTTTILFCQIYEKKKRINHGINTINVIRQKKPTQSGEKTTCNQAELIEKVNMFYLGCNMPYNKSCKLLTKLVHSRWLYFDLDPFYVLMNLNCILLCKHTKESWPISSHLDLTLSQEPHALYACVLKTVMYTVV